MFFDDLKNWLKAITSFLCVVVTLCIGCHEKVTSESSKVTASDISDFPESGSDADFHPRALGMKLDVLTSHDQLDFHLGKLVALHGVVTNTKQASILGVDIDPNNLRGKDSYAVGVLVKWDEHLSEDKVVDFQTRGPGTYYALYFDLSGELAKARQWPTSENPSK